MFAKDLSINREHREGKALLSSKALQGACMCTKARGPLVERRGRTQVQVVFRAS